MDAFSPLDVLPPLPPPPPKSRRPAGVARLCAVVLAIQLPVAIGAALVHQRHPAISLAAAADRTAAIHSARFEAKVAIRGVSSPPAGMGSLPVLAGAHRGSRTALTIALPSLGDAASDAPARRVELVRDGQVLYVRGLGAVAGGADVPAAFATIAQLGDRWGRVDLTALKAGAADYFGSSMFGTDMIDLETSLELLRTVAGDAHVVGRGEVRGVRVTNYEGKVDFGDVLAAQGSPPAAPGATAPGGLPIAEIAELFDGLRLDLAVSVGDDGIVRRVAVSFGRDLFAQLAEAFGVSNAEIPDMNVELSMELFDVNDPSIDVDVPAAADTVDVTEWAKALVG